MKTLTSWSLGVVLGLAAASTASADMLVDRGLPDANLNNAAGANRSNVSWGFAGDQYFSGDSFVTSGVWNVDTVRVWLADGSLDDSVLPGDIFSSITLYMGVAGGGVAAIPTGTGTFVSGTATDNPNIEFTRVTYAGGLNYQGQSTTEYQIWQIDFKNLNLTFGAGETVEFGVFGGDAGPFFLHASNADLSGTPQDGSNNEYLWFDRNDLAAGGGAIDSNGYGWDKSSDINVQVFGSVVPEPSAMISGGIGALILSGVGLLRRRGRRAVA